MYYSLLCISLNRKCMPPGKGCESSYKTNKNSNNKRYETVLFQNENVPSHSEKRKDFLISYILRKTKGKNQSGMCGTSNRNTRSLLSEWREYLGKAGNAGSAVEFPLYLEGSIFHRFRGSVLRDVGAVLQKKVSLGKQVWPWVLFLGTPCALSTVRAQVWEDTAFNQRFQTQTPGPFPLQDLWEPLTGSPWKTFWETLGQAVL